MKLKIAPIAFNQAPEPTDLLLGLAIVWLQLEDLLEAARRRHSVAEGQMALPLSQMTLRATRHYS